MTEERKNQLFISALKLIGTHMDEDENLVRALSERLGMTTEEMRECGIETADAPAQDIPMLFKRKISAAYENYKASWLNKTPAELIESAGEIAAVQRMAAELPECASEKDMAYLLRFKNPLEVVSDAWYSADGPGSIIDDELSHLLWEITDKQAAEADYEMEPEFYDTGPELSM